MKFGLTIFEDTNNIGDDIQSVAAMRFLPQVDYLIDRERMDLFLPDKEEQVATILNGWYLHHKFNWPPSPYIFPLLISMHFTQNDFLGIGTEFLDGQGAEYLNKYGPVGCRDLSTFHMLKQKGIDSYFSGCLTLTLEQQTNIQKESYICLVDIDQEICEAIKGVNPNVEIKTVTHTVDYSKNTLSWDERVKKVNEFLGIYQGAAFVITTRLHCALPCLALNTPVLLIYNEAESDRFKSFLEFLHYTTKKDFIKNINFYFEKSLVNKGTHNDVREKLIKKCRAFVEEARNINGKDASLPQVNLFKDYWVNKAQWQKELVLNRTNQYRQIFDSNSKWMKELNGAKIFLENQLDNYKQNNADLNKWIHDLGNAKLWLESQWNAEKEQNIKLSEGFNQLLEGKTWIESQWHKEKEQNANLTEAYKQLQESKTWIEAQWHKEKEQNANLIEAYKQLQDGKDWIEAQWSNEKAQNANLTEAYKQLQESKTWIEAQWNNEKEQNANLIEAYKQLQEGKDWIEAQWNNEKEQNANLTEAYKQLQDGKDWIEAQWNHEKESNRLLTEEFKKLENELDNTILKVSKLEYKLNLLKNDIIIKKIIKLKKYTV